MKQTMTTQKLRSTTKTKTSINKLKTKVVGIDLTKYVKKSEYDTKVGNLELKIPDVSGKLNTSDFNSKVGELDNKIKTVEQKPKPAEQISQQYQV